MRALSYGRSASGPGGWTRWEQGPREAGMWHRHGLADGLGRAGPSRAGRGPGRVMAREGRLTTAAGRRRARSATVSVIRNGEV